MILQSTELRSFLTGLILGDGSIDKGIHKRSFYIKNTHKDFIDYIENTLRENTQFKINVTYIDDKYWQLQVQSHPYFAKRYHNFYNDNRQRRIPNETLSWLSPIGIANWYMSDGYIVKVGSSKGKIKDRRVELATDRYMERDVDKIIDYFKNQYSLNLTKIKRREGVYRLRFRLYEAQFLFLSINEYVTDSFKYKLNLDYDYQPKWMCDEYYNLMNKIKEYRPPDSLEELL